VISLRFDEIPILDRIAGLQFDSAEHREQEHVYPWRLESLFPRPDSRISLVGYGSLINLKSAGRTFSWETVRQARPVIVLKARRIYEYVMSPRGREVYGDAVCESRCGVLNARPSDTVKDWFNGLEFSLGLSDMQALVGRESSYDLIPTWTIPWMDDNHSPKVSYFLSCRRSSYLGRRTLDPQLFPHPKYHAVCEEGCRDVSPSFLNAFYTSTWVRNARYIDSDCFQRVDTHQVPVA